MAKKVKQPEITSDELEIIEPDAIVTIKMSTSFYNRIQLLYTSLIADRTHTELQTAFEQMNSKKIELPWVYSLETLIILINEFQKNAKEEKKTKKISREEYTKLITKDVPVEESES